MLTPCFHLKLDARLGHGSEWSSLPVGLFSLLPHHHIEGRRVLVAEDEAGIVIIGHCVHVECALKVHTAESSVTCRTESVIEIIYITIIYFNDRC